MQRQISGGRSGAHCHKRVAKVAKALAAETYEQLMSSSDLIYSNWKKKYPHLDSKRLCRQFVADKWALFIPPARATLVGLLQQPIDEALKEEIMEILVLDSTLIRGRVNPMAVIGTATTT